jgi:bifunctional DNA-binding transcriptional regulator/antitoxin component of YhaV-PrlF toxin-antitoxin module
MALPRPDEAEDRERMVALTRALPSKAEKIRTLARAGYDRTSIARFLGISYQHVRNVLVREAETTAREASARAAEEAAPGERTYGHARIDEDGHVVLPPELFTLLELHPGGVVAWRLEDDEVILMGVDAGLRRARELLGIDLNEPRESLVDILIRERREDARKEEEDERRYMGP